MNKLEYVIDHENYILGKDKNGQTYYVKDVQNVVFPIVLEIDRVCRKNNIPYALSFGSALGIYNYGGFIPWDDDADIVFNYEDLDRLIEAFKKDLSPEYVFDCYEVDNRYNILQPTIKVKNRFGPTMVDANYKRLKDRIHSSDGFFVDMVALVPMKDAKSHRRLISRSRRRLVSYFVQDFFFNHDPLKLKAKMKADEKKYAEMYKGAKYVTQTPLLPFPSQKQNLLLKEVVYPFKEYMFNGHMLYSLNNIEAFLVQFFGKNSLKQFDGEKWIDPCPQKKRKPMHIKDFNFEK